jgi:TonB family protein
MQIERKPGFFLVSFQSLAGMILESEFYRGKFMPSDASNNKRPRNEQDLVETLGNPTASEAEWLHASEHLGEYKPKATATETRTQRTKVLGEVSILVAVGLGIWGLITFTQPSNMAPQPAPKAVQAAADVDFGPYMANLQRSIKRNWFPPKGEESKRVVCIFKVHKAGDISNLRLDRSSGNEIADRAALKAIKDASANFKALPDGASDDVDIQFTFDYNVFNKGSGVQHDAVDGEHGDSDAFSSSASN